MKDYPSRPSLTRSGLCVGSASMSGVGRKRNDCFEGPHPRKLPFADVAATYPTCPVWLVRSRPGCANSGRRSLRTPMLAIAVEASLLEEAPAASRILMEFTAAQQPLRDVGGLKSRALSGRMGGKVARHRD